MYQLLWVEVRLEMLEPPRFTVDRKRRVPVGAKRQHPVVSRPGLLHGHRLEPESIQLHRGRVLGLLEQHPRIGVAKWPRIAS